MRFSRLARFAPVLLAVLALSACGPTHEDTITDFTIEAEVHPDGTFTMSESITYDFGNVPSAGLTWEMPLTVKESLLRHRAVELTDLEVESPSGAPAAIEERTESHGWISLAIGDEDNQVTGRQTYVVTYTLDGALTELEEGAELEWDFISTGWGIPIRDTEIRVTAPEIAQVYCYASEDDSESSCETATHEETTATFSDGRLPEGYGITGIVVMPEGTVEVGDPDYVLPPLPRWLTLSGVLSLVASLATVWAFLWLATRWNKRCKTKDAERFPPHLPEGLSAAAAGYLRAKDKLKTAHLLAMLVSLEERGVVSSEPHPKRSGDWLFRLLYPDDPGISPAEQRLVAAMFGGRDTGHLKRLRKNLDAQEVKAIRKALTRELRDLGLLRPAWVEWPHTLLVLFLLCAALLYPLAIRDLTPLDPEGLESFSIVIVGLTVAGLFAFLGGTPRYGEHVKRLLAKEAKKTEDPALLVALGSGAVPEHAPDLAAYTRDDDYRREWDRTMDSHLRSTQSSSSGGGGGSVGSGGGGSSGGRR